MQWNLRTKGYLPSDYNSSLTRNDEEIDQMLTTQNDECRITRRGNISKPSDPFPIEELTKLSGAGEQRSIMVPMSINIQMLLYPLSTGEVNVTVKVYDRNAEFIQYTLVGPDGKLIRAGAVREGRTIRFNGEAGKGYFINIPSRHADMKLEVEGALIVYKSAGIAGGFMDEPFPLYFNVPEGVKSFSVTLGTKGAVADIYSPDGRHIDQLNNTENAVTRLVIAEKDTKPGFWKIVFHPFTGNIRFTMDEQIPNWFIPVPN